MRYKSVFVFVLINEMKRLHQLLFKCVVKARNLLKNGLECLLKTKIDRGVVIGAVFGTQRILSVKKPSVKRLKAMMEPFKPQERLLSLVSSYIGHLCLCFD